MSKITTKSTNSLRAAAAIVAASFVLAACGSGSASDPTPVVTEITISAAPAFLSRSCDGQDSPQLFCPNVNGG